jgi:hypothetical protein
MKESILVGAELSDILPASLAAGQVIHAAGADAVYGHGCINVHPKFLQNSEYVIYNILYNENVLKSSCLS